MAGTDLETLAHIDVAHGGHHATLRLAPGIPEADLNEPALLACVTARLRPCDELFEKVQEAIRLYRASPEGVELVVAHGVPPVHGQDGRFEFAPGMDPRALAEGAEPELPAPDEKIDHRARSVLRLVRAGQAIGTLYPPTPGRDGYDVTGRALASKDGHEYPLRTDETVTRLPNGVLVAAIDGALEYDPPKLRVRGKIVIDSFVDYSTGNVEFPGEVEITKGVRDCFVVRTGGSVLIHGLVEAATVMAGLDATLRCGMAAREKGWLGAARDLSAKYLDNTRVEVGRDLTVEKEIINCQVSVGRRFLADTCAVTGGTLIVTQRCSLAQLGTPAGVPTKVVLGRVAVLEQLTDQAQDLLPALEARAAKLQEQLLQIKNASGRMSKAQAAEVAELELQVATSKAKAATLVAALAKARDTAGAVAAIDLVVRRRVCSGVTIYAGPWVAEITMDLKGPLRVHGDLGGALLLTDLSREATVSLSKVARVRRHDRYQGPQLLPVVGEAGRPAA